MALPNRPGWKPYHLAIELLAVWEIYVGARLARRWYHISSGEPFSNLL